MATRILYDEDNNPVEVEVPDTKDGPADLRKALKKEQTERAADRAELETLKAQMRTSNVESTLTAKGVPAKIAKFIPSDVTTPDQVNLWLTENADVFGFQPIVDAGAPDDARTKLASDLARINNATNSGTSATTEADLLNQINNPNLDRAALDAITGVGYQPNAGRRTY